jgi:hypothetical protein
MTSLPIRGLGKRWKQILEQELSISEIKSLRDIRL